MPTRENQYACHHKSLQIIKILERFKLSRSHYFFSFLFPECMISHKVCNNSHSIKISHRPTPPSAKNSRSDSRPINFFSSPLIYTLNYFRQFNTHNNQGQGQGQGQGPVTSLLLDICFNSCKKQNTTFKWQTEKYRLEMSARYRTALFFSIVVHV